MSQVHTKISDSQRVWTFLDWSSPSIVCLNCYGPLPLHSLGAVVRHSHPGGLSLVSFHLLALCSAPGPQPAPLHSQQGALGPQSHTFPILIKMFTQRHLPCVCVYPGG